MIFEMLVGFRGVKKGNCEPHQSGFYHLLLFHDNFFVQLFSGIRVAFLRRVCSRYD
jgi:hypothetical protein